MKKNFSDINVEISQILNRAMYEFDEMPGSSRSVLADSASRDLSGISVNFKFFRLLAFALLAIFLWKMKDFSIALASGLAWLHIVAAPMDLQILMLALIFIGGWIAFFNYVSYIKKRNFQLMSEVERDMVQNIRALADALPGNCGMLAQNFRELAQRMTKIFPMREKQIVSEFMRLTQAVFDKDVCDALALNDACVVEVRRLQELMLLQRADLKIR